MSWSCDVLWQDTCELALNPITGHAQPGLSSNVKYVPQWQPVFTAASHPVRV